MIMTLVVMTYCLIVIQSINVEWLLDIKIKQEGKTLSEKVESRGDRLYKYVESNWRETRGGGKSGDGTSHQVLKDFENIIKNARVIEKWSIIMSEYFPKGSGQGNTNASENIWLDFNSFQLKISENTTATRALIAAAEAKSISDIKQLTNNLGSTCQSCHMKFKR